MAHRHRLSLVDQNHGNSITALDEPRPIWLPRLNGSLFTAANGYDGQVWVSATTSIQSELTTHGIGQAELDKTCGRMLMVGSSGLGRSLLRLLKPSAFFTFVMSPMIM